MSIRSDFRRRLSQPGIVHQPVVFDGLGARMAQEIGFEAIALGGYAMGAHTATSEPLLSLSDVAAITRQVSLVSSLPVMVDAGAGYGEPVHVMHTVRVLEQAGAASIHIEDQIYPKRVHYHAGIEHVVELDEYLTKIRTAVRARRDPDFVIVARTDAMRTDDYDEGIRRARAAVEAGADAVMLFPNDEDETRAAPADLPGVPLVYVVSSGNRLDRGVFSTGELDAWGWKVASDAISTINVTARALRSVLTTMRETGSNGLDQHEMIGVRKALEDTIGLDEHYALERETVER